jgi:uncharacterized protein (TIGR04255 family)
MIPDYPVERLWNDPLAWVVAQLRFPPLSSFQSRPTLNPLFDALTVDYPHYSEERGVSLVLDDKGIRNQEGEKSHRFLSIDMLWAVTLGSESMSLECRRGGYEDIDNFISRFSRIARLLEQLGLKKQTRIGFRFVNEIRPTPSNGDYEFWREQLNPKVIGYDAAEQFGGKVLSTVSEVNIRRDDGTLRVRRGFLPGGSTVPQMMTPRGLTPTPSDSFYLVDLDYFDDSPIDFTPDVHERLRMYNHFMYRVFRWIIGDGLLWQNLKGDKK